MLTQSDFARTRGVDPKTVSIYMVRHGMIYDKERGLSPDQIEKLDAVYPLPAPIQIVEDTESIKKLIATQEQLIKLQDEYSELKGQLLLAANEKYKMELLEQKSEEQDARIRQLEEENHRLKNRNLWQRILNK